MHWIETTLAKAQLAFFVNHSGPLSARQLPDGPVTARYRFVKNAYWEIP